jgi:predicted RNA binding protein YcfA (HicA-like mRNA interferase family)
MPPLPVVSGREAVRAFERAGWVLARRAGSHMILTKAGSQVNLSVPDHRELDRGLLRKLIQTSGLSVEEFLSYLDVAGR